MMVGVRDGRTVPVEPFAPFAVGGEDRAIDVRCFLLQPAKQGWTEIEADPRIVVDDADDAATRVEDAGPGIRPVAFGGDPLVPVVVRIRRVLELHDLEPRVLPRWLVEVSVDTDVLHGRLPSVTRLKITIASGGNVKVNDQDRPCQGTGTASTPPRFPQPLPP